MTGGIFDSGGVLLHQLFSKNAIRASDSVLILFISPQTVNTRLHIIQQWGGSCASPVAERFVAQLSHCIKPCLIPVVWDPCRENTRYTLPPAHVLPSVRLSSINKPDERMWWIPASSGRAGVCSVRIQLPGEPSYAPTRHVAVSQAVTQFCLSIVFSWGEGGSNSSSATEEGGLMLLFPPPILVLSPVVVLRQLGGKKIAFDYYLNMFKTPTVCLRLKKLHFTS